jgi:hypothetical protein
MRAALEYKGDLGLVVKTNVKDYSVDKPLQILVTNVPVNVSNEDVIKALPIAPTSIGFISFKRTKKASQCLGIMSITKREVFHELLKIGKFSCGGQELVMKLSRYSENAEVVRLWLGWLPSNVNVKRLDAVLRSFRLAPVAIHVPRHPDSNAQKGFAFVTFGSNEEAARAFYLVFNLKGHLVHFDIVSTKNGDNKSK